MPQTNKPNQPGSPLTGNIALWVAGCIALVFLGLFLRSRFAAHGPGHEQTAGIQKKWEFSPAGMFTSALALAADGTLYAPSEDGFLYALDPTGNLKWKFNAGLMKGAPAIGPDGTIYISNDIQRIYAINPSGTQQWAAGGGRYSNKGLGRIAAAIDDNNLYTFWRSDLHAQPLNGGTYAWVAGMGIETNGCVAILPNGVTVFPEVGRLEAVENDGRTAWDYPEPNSPITVDYLLEHNGRPPAGNFWQESAMAIGALGTLYMSAATSRYVAIGMDGAFKWEFKTKPGTLNFASPVIAPDGTIYFASGDGNLYAVTPDGTQKWLLDTKGAISATPVIAEDETVYLVNANQLMAVSPDGKLLEKVQLTGGAISAPTLATDGTLYIAGRNGKVMAFAGTHGGLIHSPWPKFQHDLANTGRAPHI